MGAREFSTQIARCHRDNAMRFESHTSKALAMRKSFFTSAAKPPLGPQIASDAKSFFTSDAKTPHCPQVPLWIHRAPPRKSRGVGPRSHKKKIGMFFIPELPRSACDSESGCSLPGSRFDPRPQRLPIFHLILGGRSESLLRKPGALSKGVKVLEIAVGALFAPTRFSLVRVSIRDLVADRNPNCRNQNYSGSGQMFPEINFWKITHFIAG